MQAELRLSVCSLLLNKSISNAAEVWKIQSDKNMENSLLKVTVSTRGTLVIVSLILKKDFLVHIL